MDIIAGGGKYGCKAVEYLRGKRRGFVLVDKNPSCLAREIFGLKSNARLGAEGEYFIQGDLSTVSELIDSQKPEYVFPTVPMHVAAELAKIRFKLKPWAEEVNSIIAKLPSNIILQAGRGNLIVSFNRDEKCVEFCEAPEVCPSTRKSRPCTMDKLMRFACSEGFILISHQMAPGMGALKGIELLEFFEWAEKKERFVVGIACDCHGCFAAFKKDLQ
jgi:hypothetical protein